MPTKPIALTRKDELTVVTNHEKQGLRSITTKKPLRLMRTGYDPVVSVDRGVRGKDCYHVPITLLLTAPCERLLEFPFKEEMHIENILHNRLFHLESFARDPMICVSGYSDIFIQALSEALKDGKLFFEKDKKTVMVRYFLKPDSYHTRIPRKDAFHFFDGL